MRRARLFAVVAVAASMTLAACGSSSSGSPASSGSKSGSDGGGKTLSLKVGVPSTSGAMTPLWLAYDKGLFARYGLKVSLVTIAPSASASALLGNQIDVMMQSPTTVVTADVNGGGDLVYIGLEQNKSPYSFVTAANASTAATLKGKKIGSDRPGTGADYRTGAFLHLMGLKPSDVQTLQLGGPDVVTAALESGQVAAGAVVPPFTFELQKKGFKIVEKGTDISGGDFSFGAIVRKSHISADKAAFSAFIKGLQAGIKLYLSNPGLAKSTFAKYAKVTDPTVLQQTYSTYKALFNPSLKMDPTTLQALINYLANNILPKAKGKSASDFIDSTFVNQLK